MGLLRDAREALATLRLLRGLRRDAARRGEISSTAGPGSPSAAHGAAPRRRPRPQLRPRPLARAIHATAPRRRRSPSPRARPPRRCAHLRGRCGAGCRPTGPSVIAGHADAGRVTVRRLRPEDGYVWEMPGVRVFAIVGVQAFTVDDEA